MRSIDAALYYPPFTVTLTQNAAKCAYGTGKKQGKKQGRKWDGAG